ncbi:hypothetical protein A7K73_07765 [Candidatus Methylacidiphilum fumarolicum]|nr:hypothetical protein A7K73_07765 [Candidatus Methylacidiphilum fumarolicum]
MLVIREQKVVGLQLLLQGQRFVPDPPHPSPVTGETQVWFGDRFQTESKCLENFQLLLVFTRFMTKSNESPTARHIAYITFMCIWSLLLNISTEGPPKEILKDLCQFIDSVYKDFGSEWLEVDGEDNHTGSFW